MKPKRPDQRRLFRPESVSRSLGVYLPATAAARGIGLVRGIILARLISEHEYGLFQIALVLINVLNPLCALGLNEGLARYVPMYETRGTLRAYLRRVAPFILAVGLIGCAIVYAAAAPIGRIAFSTLHATSLSGDADWAALTRMAAGCTFAVIAYMMAYSALKGLRMFRALSLMEFLQNALMLALVVGTTLSGFKSAHAMLVCYAIALVALLPFFLPPMWRTIAWPAPSDDAQESVPPVVEDASMPDESGLQPSMIGGRHAAENASTSLLTQILKFSVWSAIAAVIWQVLQYYPMWYLQKIHGSTATAVFGGVRLITQVVVVGAVTIVAVVQTSVTKTWEAEGHAPADARLRVAYKTTSLLMLFGCVVFAALAGPIMHLFPPSYRVGAIIVPLSLTFFLVSGHLIFLAVHFALIEKMRHLFLPWAAGLAGNVILSAMLVSHGMPLQRALIGAAWAGTLGILAALLLAILLLCRERRPIDLGTVVLWLTVLVPALPRWLSLVAMAALCAAIMLTDQILTREDKQRLNTSATGAWRQLMDRLR